MTAVMRTHSPGEVATSPTGHTALAGWDAESSVAGDAGTVRAHPSLLLAAALEAGARPGDAAVYAGIGRHANGDGVAVVSHRALAGLLDCSTGRVAGALCRLEALRLLVTTRRPKGPDGRRPTSSYQVCAGPWAGLWRAPGAGRARTGNLRRARVAGLAKRRAALEAKLAGAARGAAAAAKRAQKRAQDLTWPAGGSARRSARRKRAQSLRDNASGPSGSPLAIGAAHSSDLLEQPPADAGTVTRYAAAARDALRHQRS